MMEAPGENAQMPSTCVPPFLGEHRARIVEYLRTIALPRDCVAGKIVAESVAGADRRWLLRPILVVWSGTACGARVDDLVPVAAAFDFFDRFMVLHDELVEPPARANTQSPVGRWGLGQSLNAGDALYALGLRTLACDVRDAGARLAAAGFVTQAVLEAIEGRTRDVGTTGLVEESAAGALRRRSAVLTAAALEAGTILGNRPDLQRSFHIAGRLLDAATAGDDSSQRRAAARRASAAIERSALPAERSASFHDVVRYVAVAGR